LTTPLNTAAIKIQAAALGFSGAGVTRALPAPTLDAYERWIDAGMHADMGYMARPDRVARRRDLNVILPGVRSLVVVTCDYGAVVPAAWLHDPVRGRIAAYAWGADYHPLMTDRLEALADSLRTQMGAMYKVYVDTGAILERAHGVEAGLGFVGKNTMLIDPRRGSRFFLGVLLTDAPFDHYDTPGRAGGCGTCTRCLAACPTDAFPAPHILDARRCISYWTIEHKDAIRRDLRASFGNWVYGCDVCNDVCPWQRFASPTGDPAFIAVDADRVAPRLYDLLTLDADGFARRYGGSAIVRVGRDRLVRNACVAAGNAPEAVRADLVTPLIDRLDDAQPIVRGHAAWALGRIGDSLGRSALSARLTDETDDQIRDEIVAALG